MLPYILFWLFLIIIIYKLHYPRNVVPLIILVASFSAFRDGIGSDYKMYYEVVEGSSTNRDFEMIPAMIVNLAHGTSYSLFFIISAFFTVTAILLCVKYKSKRDEYFWARSLLFISFPYFYIQSLTIVRQYMAFTFIFIAITLFKENWKRQLYMVILAFLCHRSAIIGILVLLPLEKMGKRTLWVMFIVSLIVGESFSLIILSMSIDFGLFLQLQEYLYNADLYKGGATMKYIVYILTALSLLKYSKIVRKNKEYSYHISLVTIGASLQSLLGMSPHTALRMCTFFFIAIIVYFPYIIKPFRNKFLVTTGCILLFFAYLRVLHNSEKDSRGKSCWIPYKSIIININE